MLAAAAREYWRLPAAGSCGPCPGSSELGDADCELPLPRASAWAVPFTGPVGKLGDGRGGRFLGLLSSEHGTKGSSACAVPCKGDPHARKNPPPRLCPHDRSGA